MKKKILGKILWAVGKRYELSGDGKGLRKYFKPGNFYHIHSSEMTMAEIIRHRVLTKFKKTMQFA